MKDELPPADLEETKRVGQSAMAAEVRRRSLDILIWIVVIFIVLLLAKVAFRDQPQVRVAPTKSDMRSLATTIEAYFADHGQYPAYSTEPELSAAGIAYDGKSNGRQPWNTPTFRMKHETDLATLTTPMAYINYHFSDRFAEQRGRPHHYYSNSVGDAQGWILYSPGPDGDVDITETDYDVTIPQPSLHLIVNRSYDSSNGTISDGDIWRVRQ